MRALLITSGAILLALIFFVIGYRGGWFLSDNDRIGDAIRFALPEDADAATTTLKFDELVDGEWDRLVITCWGMTADEIHQALGQKATPEDIKGQRSTVVLYFMTGDDIDKTYVRDADIMAEPVYFEPCSRNGELVEDPIVLAREDAQLDMERDDAVRERWVLASS